jgi:hypothetical protein
MRRDQMRFPSYVRRCAHTHEWIVTWLISHGWNLFAVTIPSRVEVLGGSQDPGWTALTREVVIEDIRRIGYLRVPGARWPKQKLSATEWRTLDTAVVSEHNRLGLDMPPYRKRRGSISSLHGP